MWLGVDLRTDSKKTCVEERLDCMLKLCANHSRFDSRHDWGTCVTTYGTRIKGHENLHFENV